MFEMHNIYPCVLPRCWCRICPYRWTLSESVRWPNDVETWSQFKFTGFYSFICSFINSINSYITSYTNLFSQDKFIHEFICIIKAFIVHSFITSYIHLISQDKSAVVEFSEPKHAENFTRQHNR